jgi:hypothetical protein
VRRDIISSKTKKKHWPRHESRGEASPSWSFNEGDVPWILKKHDFSMEKDVIMGVKAPSFIWVDSMILLYYRREFVGVEIT